MKPDTVLVRARDILVRIGDADDVRIVQGDDQLEASPLALTILHAFAHPRTIADVLATAASGPESWIELSSTVLQLAKAGVLVAPGTAGGAVRGYAQPSVHIVMLDDHARTRAFIDALRALVREDDIVLDIGTGTGILATTAALAGAARVEAVESSAIADAAQRVFEANGVAGRVNLVRGRSTRVTLAERADVLVTEMIGNDPLDEHLLEIVADAKSRLLKPGARLIPSAIDIVAIAVDVPQRFLERRLFTPERTSAWKAMYGVELSSLLSVRRTPSQPILVQTADFLSFQRVAPPVTIASIDLTSPFELAYGMRVPFTLERDVEHLGVLLAFRTTLAPGIVLSTLPDAVDPANHWLYPLWPSLDRPAWAREETVTLDYRYARGTTTLSFS